MDAVTSQRQANSILWITALWSSLSTIIFILCEIFGPRPIDVKAFCFFIVIFFSAASLPWTKNKGAAGLVTIFFTLVAILVAAGGAWITYKVEPLTMQVIVGVIALLALVFFAGPAWYSWRAKRAIDYLKS